MSNYDSKLWSDDPSDIDLLSFQAVAETAADAIVDPALDPIAVGLSGSWGSGKTTVLRLVKAELIARSTTDDKISVVETDPWRYDPAVGAKETLIGEVLTALESEIDAGSADESVKEQAKALAKKLAGRIDWAKAVKLAAKTSIALQLPSMDDVLGLVRGTEAGGEEKTLAAFRDEFAELMESEALAHVRTVAVLVDDLDRCLPESVIESLEAMRLFLAVKGMSFVIAADEDRVAEAIATRYEGKGEGEGGESPAQLYLHKIVQTTIPVPSLSQFDTQSFLLLLQARHEFDDSGLEKLAVKCADLRSKGEPLDSIGTFEGVDLTDAVTFAGRLTPLLYESKGNPRRVKRFLNDLAVRQAIATRRGITLDTPVFAKLMILEKLLADGFEKLLDWLARGELKTQLAALEAAADKTGDDSTDGEADPETEAEFSDRMLRWAKLSPPLADIDLGPYLYLAATFTGRPIFDPDLPERLRDISASLLSSSAAEQRGVSTEDIAALGPEDAALVLEHLGRAVRDQPDRQKAGFTGILRIARAHPSKAGVAGKAMELLPSSETSFASVLLVAPGDPEEIYAWVGQLAETGKDEVQRAAQTTLDRRES